MKNLFLKLTVFCLLFPFSYVSFAQKHDNLPKFFTKNYELVKGNNSNKTTFIKKKEITQIEYSEYLSSVGESEKIVGNSENFNKSIPLTTEEAKNYCNWLEKTLNTNYPKRTFIVSFTEKKSSVTKSKKTKLLLKPIVKVI